MRLAMVVAGIALLVVAAVVVPCLLQAGEVAPASGYSLLSPIRSGNLLSRLAVREDHRRRNRDLFRHEAGIVLFWADGGNIHRISFGTGQRFASRGCFIVQLSHGDVPELVKKSGWIVH